MCPFRVCVWVYATDVQRLEGTGHSGRAFWFPCSWLIPAPSLAGKGCLTTRRLSRAQSLEARGRPREGGTEDTPRAAALVVARSLRTRAAVCWRQDDAAQGGPSVARWPFCGFLSEPGRQPVTAGHEALAERLCTHDSYSRLWKCWTDVQRQALSPGADTISHYGLEGSFSEIQYQDDISIKSLGICFFVNTQT